MSPCGATIFTTRSAENISVVVITWCINKICMYLCASLANLISSLSIILDFFINHRFTRINTDKNLKYFLSCDLHNNLHITLRGNYFITQRLIICSLVVTTWCINKICVYLCASLANLISSLSIILDFFINHRFTRINTDKNSKYWLSCDLHNNLHVTLRGNYFHYQIGREYFCSCHHMVH